MDISRRRFLFLCASAAPALWLARVGIIRLSGHMVAVLGGGCSFCRKRSSMVGRLAGVVGRPVRICDECIGLCLDILAEEREREEGVPPVRPPTPARPPEAMPEMDELEALVSTLGSGRPRDEEIEHVRHVLDGLSRREPPPVSEFCCSFCDAARRDVAKLISGPRVFICDGCVGAGAAICSSVLRPV